MSESESVLAFSRMLLSIYLTPFIYNFTGVNWKGCLVMVHDCHNRYYEILAMLCMVYIIIMTGACNPKAWLECCGNKSRQYDIDRKFKTTRTYGALYANSPTCVTIKHGILPAKGLYQQKSLNSVVLHGMISEWNFTAYPSTCLIVLRNLCGDNFHTRLLLGGQDVCISLFSCCLLWMRQSPWTTNKLLLFCFGANNMWWSISMPAFPDHH